MFHDAPECSMVLIGTARGTFSVHPDKLGLCVDALASRLGDVLENLECGVLSDDVADARLLMDVGGEAYADLCGPIVEAFEAGE